jgi:hypothetical protein
LKSQNAALDRLRSLIEIAVNWNIEKLHREEIVVDAMNTFPQVNVIQQIQK